jgi:uncharacterized protein (DUF302 family)
MIKTILLSCLLVIGLVAQEKNVTIEEHVQQSDIQIFTSANKEKNITAQTIQEALEKAGFFVSENRDMNVPFKKQFNESDFTLYNLLTFYKRETAIALTQKYENIGLFTPMSLSIYTKKGTDTISVAMLSPQAMAKIMTIPADEKLLLELNTLVVETLKSALPEAKHEKVSYKTTKPIGELVTTLTMEMDAEEWEDELEEFKMGFEGELLANGFVVAGYNNLGDEFEDANYEAFDVYEVYSICKLPVIFTIAKRRPEAGAFAPCSLYVAKKKDENKLTVSFPSVYNWISSLAISDSKEIKVLQDAQKRMRDILTSVTE